MRSARRISLLAALGGVTPACQDDHVPELTMVLDATQDQKLVFRPKAAFAEYVELPDTRHELRLTLASYETTCDEYRPPGEDEQAITITLLTPPKEPPAPGEYGFGLLPSEEQPLATALAIPKGHLQGRTYVFQPGGGLKLSTVVLEPYGTVAGSLDFSYPGDAEHPATRIQGRFSAWLCSNAPAPKR